MKDAKKITSILIIASISMVIFAGCGSTSTTVTKINTTKSQTSKVNPTAEKTLYTDTLKTLVTSKAITQAQSDKVLAALTTKETTDKNSANKPSGTKHKNNQLSSLVTSGVITQTQVYTISTKIAEAMKNSKSK